MPSDVDAVLHRVGERCNVPPAQLEQAKRFVTAVVLPAFESLRPELEAVGLVTITPASEMPRPTDRNVVYSGIRVGTEERSEIELRICLRLNAAGVAVEPEEISWVQGQRTRFVGWGSSGPRNPTLLTLTVDDITRTFRERYARAEKSFEHSDLF